MKKILLVGFLITIALLAGMSNADDSSPKEAAVFISKESSRSMSDQNTFRYYEKLREKFEVTILKDSEVAANSASWRDAYNESVLIFVIGQSGETLSVNRTKFCGNLSIVLGKIKGVFFAGNSLMYSEAFRGCPYTAFFDFAAESNNTEMANKTINITKQHQITSGYGQRPYNISVADTIYTINDLKEGQVLATAYGDPDGVGPTQAGNYAAIAIKEGMRYRSVLWAINTSEIDCPGCLGWTVFNQALDWASNTSDMGYWITTDKGLYQQGDEIYINVTAHATISSVSGNITRPDGLTEGLSISGSGNMWTSYYPTFEDDPDGVYKINMNADGIFRQKNVTIKAFDIGLDIRSDENGTWIQASVKDQHDSYVKNVNVTINITDSLGQRFGYSTAGGEITDHGNGTFVLVFNVSPGIFGKHLVYAFAEDALERNDTATDSFSISPPFKMELYPEGLEKVVFEPGNFTGFVQITNTGPSNLTGITVSKTGDVKDWIDLSATSLPDITPNSTVYFYFNVTVPDIGQGNYTGSIVFSTEQGEKTFPMSVQMKFIGKLLVDPSTLTDYAPVDEIVLKEITLSNPERGDISIISVDVGGDLVDWVVVQKRPEKIVGGSSEKMVLKIDTSAVNVENAIRTLFAIVEITTDFPDENKGITLEIIAVKNIANEANSLLSRIPELQNRISALEKDVDVSSVGNGLSAVKDDLESIKNLYQEKKYEEAATKFDDAKKNLPSVEGDISGLEEKVEAEKAAERTRIFVAYVLMVIVIVGAVVFLFSVLKLKPWSEYQKLRKKWKGKS